MAAAKKTTKSNKTAHVLNLLTAPGEQKETPAAQPEPAAEKPEAAAAPSVPAPAEEPAAATRPLTPPILEVARTNDLQISEQIRGALEEELAAELGKMEAANRLPADMIILHTI